MSGVSWIRLHLYGNYQVTRTEFKYRQAHCGRPGSVEVSGNLGVGYKTIASGAVRTRTCRHTNDWGINNQLQGNQITFSAGGGSPWCHCNWGASRSTLPCTLRCRARLRVTCYSLMLVISFR